MDVAIPIFGGDNAFIIYILDNKDTVSDLNNQLFQIIMQALIIGLLISVLLSFLLSKTMVGPIEKLTIGAERVAAGDFDSELPVESTDEIGILTGTFNEMAGVLQSTLAAVENERNKLDTLFLHMTDGVVAFDREGHLIHCNPAATELLRRSIDPSCTYEELLGDLHPFQNVLALQKPNYIEDELVVGDRTLALYLTPFSDKAQGGVLILLHDVTEQHRNEERRKEFVANVSHELRTPLTNVRSYAETIRDAGDDIPREMENSFLDIIITETDRMTHIVQDLLTLSRLDAGSTEMVFTRFPFGDAIESVVRSNSLNAKQRGHELTYAAGGRAAPDHRRPEPPGAGDDEHSRQRHQIHSGRRTHPRHRRSRRPTPSGWRSAMTASASRKRTGTAFSTASTGWTRPVPGNPAAPAWDYPSPGRSSSGTTAPFPWSPMRDRAPRSVWSCPSPSPPPAHRRIRQKTRRLSSNFSFYQERRDRPCATGILSKISPSRFWRCCPCSSFPERSFSSWALPPAAATWQRLTAPVSDQISDAPSSDTLSAPVRAAVTGEYGRYGSISLTTDSESFTPIKTLLREVLGSARSRMDSSAAAFRSALGKPSVYCDFLEPLPVSYLADLMGITAESELSVRALAAAEQNGQVVLLLWDGGIPLLPVRHCRAALYPDGGTGSL